MMRRDTAPLTTPGSGGVPARRRPPRPGRHRLPRLRADRQRPAHPVRPAYPRTCRSAPATWRRPSGCCARPGTPTG
ncbi:hypothetical protein NKH77_04385 [Streptomyces sp. M19]